MHAALVRLRIDRAQAPAAAAAFTHDILPRIRAAEGFSGGYWLDPEDGEGFGFVLFATAEQARRAPLGPADQTAPGVEILDVSVRRVAVAIPE